jgi:type II secretory pathway component GspD/PulD (secretin)
MAKFTWTCVHSVTVLVCACALQITAHAANHDKQKEHAVMGVLQLAGADSLTPQQKLAVERSSALESITQESLGNDARLLLKTDGTSVCDFFTLENGRRVVVDLYDTVTIESGLVKTPQSTGPIALITNSLQETHPQFVSRVVVDLNRPVRPRIDFDSDTVILTMAATSVGDQTDTLAKKVERSLTDLHAQERQLSIVDARIEETEQRWIDGLGVDPRPTGGDFPELLVSAISRFMPEHDALTQTWAENQADSNAYLQAKVGELNEVKAGLASKRPAMKKLTRNYTALKQEINKFLVNDSARHSVLEAKWADFVVRSSKELQPLIASLPAETEQNGIVESDIGVEENGAQEESLTFAPEKIVVASTETPGTDAVDKLVAELAGKIVEETKTKESKDEQIAGSEVSETTVAEIEDTVAEKQAEETTSNEPDISETDKTTTLETAAVATPAEDSTPAAAINEPLAQSLEEVVRLAKAIETDLAELVAAEEAALEAANNAEVAAEEEAQPDTQQTGQGSVADIAKTATEDDTAALEAGSDTEPVESPAPTEEIPTTDPEAIVVAALDSTPVEDAPEQSVEYETHNNDVQDEIAGTENIASGDTEAVEPAEEEPIEQNSEETVLTESIDSPIETVAATLAAMESSLPVTPMQHQYLTVIPESTQAKLVAPVQIAALDASDIEEARYEEVVEEATQKEEPATTEEIENPELSIVETDIVEPVDTMEETDPVVLAVTADEPGIVEAESVATEQKPTLPAIDTVSGEETEPVRAINASEELPVAPEATILAAAVEEQPVPRNLQTHATPRAAVPQWTGDPLMQPITMKFVENPLSTVVGILGEMAGINIIGGSELTGQTVTMTLEDVPLIKAMETILRMNDLGVVEEFGIYRIVPYAEALDENRMQEIVYLKNAQASEIDQTIQAILQKEPNGDLISVAPNDATNTVVVSGPAERIGSILGVIRSLDVAEPTLPLATEVFKLNYAQPQEVMAAIEIILTEKTGEEAAGEVAMDPRGRHLIVTDYPIVIESVREVIASLDMPVHQVSIDAMIVDVVLNDQAQTGVDWLLDAVNKRSPYPGRVITGTLDGRTNNRGLVTGTLDDLTAAGQLDPNLDAAGVLTFSTLAGNFDISGVLTAEINNSNAEILANPKLNTLENVEASIDIGQQIPVRQINETDQGGRISGVEFKPTGTLVSVTPRVTSDMHVISMIDVEQSFASGFIEENPIIDTRHTQTTLRSKDSETVLIGGLRRVDDNLDVRKFPVLGDIPVLNVAFRKSDVRKTNTELLVFLTCRVQDMAPILSAKEQDHLERMEEHPDIPDAERALYRSYWRPEEMRDPIMKFRRAE